MRIRRTIKLKCDAPKCGKEFYKPISEYNRSTKNGKRHFCSKSCAASISSPTIALRIRSEILQKGEKICGKCQLLKPLSEFNKKGDWYVSKCRECSKNNWKIWYLNNKKKHINKQRLRNVSKVKEYKAFKSSLKCSFCDENTSCCLSFHHKDGKTKDFNLSDKPKCFSTPKFERELKKCICICLNCHAKVNAGILTCD